MASLRFVKLVYDSYTAMVEYRLTSNGRYGEVLRKPPGWNAGSASNSRQKSQERQC